MIQYVLYIIRVCLFVGIRGPDIFQSQEIASLIASQLVALSLIICVWLLAPHSKHCLGDILTAYQRLSAF